ncbi:hypothetical protein [Enterococcus lemanii]|uniref:Uncharacterized protein n=1 Tax=Enterococcus lemanii TaxID=1159752 RepID=A0ABV9MYD5_9ENTE|nr:hypothetical protein [Enterococcus lemanii]MBM7708815.1 hypothetical protein [Enterococcus lemanii]MCB0749537.1 hypothetical protein [Ignavibacteriota bacterium]
MPHFDFRPAVMGTRFYRYGRGMSGDNHITKIEFDSSDDVFELGFELTLGGLSYLKYPDDYMDIIGKDSFNHQGYQPFYVNFIFFIQEGMKVNTLINHHSIYVSEEMLKEDSVNIMYTVTKFRKDLEQEFGYSSDFTQSMYHLNVIISDEEIKLDKNNDSEISDFIFNNYNTIFKTKIPYIAERNTKNE